MQNEDGGRRWRLNTEVGLRPSIDHSVADPVKAVTEVKYQEISLPLSHSHTHTSTQAHTSTHSLLILR